MKVSKENNIPDMDPKDCWSGSTPYFDMDKNIETENSGQNVSGNTKVKVSICGPSSAEKCMIDVDKEDLISLEEVTEIDKAEELESSRTNTDQYKTRVLVNNETNEDLRAQINKANEVIAYKIKKVKLEEKKPEGKRPEMINHPAHYNLKDGPYLIVDKKKVSIECIDVIRNMPTWKGNVIKYLWRCGEKHEEGLTNKEKELEDMKKALWYLQDKINEMERVFCDS